jgi:2-polyprenyl-6-methoxyphenol hydroxylase-like FAD-dependent oxidoreductase
MLTPPSRSVRAQDGGKRVWWERRCTTSTGYHKDAVTAQGITDAFRDAEIVSSALDDAFAGRRSQDAVLTAYERTRDESTRPMFDLTCQLASNDPPSDDEVELFASIATREDATQDFVSVLAGTMPVEAFFDPANLERYAPVPRTSAGTV